MSHPHSCPPTYGNQRGAAILIAMLTVALVAALAAAVLWQQWRDVEVETTQRARAQAYWALLGAVDWARLNSGGQNTAIAPISNTENTLVAELTSQGLSADAREGTDILRLSGETEDVLARMNIANLVQNGEVSEPHRRAFSRLFGMLGLPASELSKMLDALRQTQTVDYSGAYDPNTPLWPTDIDQLVWLGLSARSIESLRPFVSTLSTPSKINLNTAPAEVLYASIDGFSLADAQRLVAARRLKPFASLADAKNAGGNPGIVLNEEVHTVSSNVFRVRRTLSGNAREVGVNRLLQPEENKFRRRQRTVPL